MISVMAKCVWPKAMSSKISFGPAEIFIFISRTQHREKSQIMAFCQTDSKTISPSLCIYMYTYFFFKHGSDIQLTTGLYCNLESEFDFLFKHEINKHKSFFEFIYWISILFNLSPWKFFSAFDQRGSEVNIHKTTSSPKLPSNVSPETVIYVLKIKIFSIYFQ